MYHDLTLPACGDLNVSLHFPLQLKVTKDRKLITVQLDTSGTQEAEIRRKVDVIAPIYVGGLPHVFQPREGLVCTIDIPVSVDYNVGLTAVSLEFCSFSLSHTGVCQLPRLYSQLLPECQARRSFQLQVCHGSVKLFHLCGEGCLLWRQSSGYLLWVTCCAESCLSKALKVEHLC